MIVNHNGNSSPPHLQFAQLSHTDSIDWKTPSAYLIPPTAQSHNEGSNEELGMKQNLYDKLQKMFAGSLW